MRPPPDTSRAPVSPPPSRLARLRRLLGPGLMLLTLLPAACALPAWVHGAPRFPSNDGGPWELPLYEPLTQIGPKIVATVCGAAPTPDHPAACEEVLLFVDSGSSHSALPAATFERLQIPMTSSRLATISDASGVKRSWSGALVPEIRVGGRFTLQEVVASIHEGTPILGADVLAAHGWQLDLDRGTLVLGPPPWSPSPEILAPPTRSWASHAIVDLDVEGRTVPVLVDTGAPVTVVERQLLRGLGRPERSLAFPFPLGERPDSPKLESTFQVEVALGGRSLGPRSVPALPVAGAPSSQGMLGFDLLSMHVFQITPAGLRLKPRNRSSIVVDVATRIARWPDLPRCPENPGCVTAAMPAPGDPAARARVRVIATFPHPVRLLFGCVDNDGRLDAFPLWLEVFLRHPVGGAEIETAPAVGAGARQVWSSRCGRLALLDVNPVVASARPPAAEVESRLVFDGRNVHLQ